ncbi:hypothetical protein [Gordonia liuliyuniae]|uniref:Uncharacterized protein n=1 Tax=Gordonia liuliyuniae TaxID=2911517 RepID=A0ABS9IP71_9ACTN|nr:hypothetical protein [Gordonia liuliyuniae]MCF8587358.1 hypothetical protein [Gordonia liuliyuniae]
MSGGRCWSSIVATPNERSALRLGVDAEWLVGCVLPEGHPGAHASDGAQEHHGRRRWLVWGDFARGAQMLRDEEPCPNTELDGTPCLYYLGHSGAHRYPGIPEGPSSDGFASPMDRRPAPQAPRPDQRGFPPTQPWNALTQFDIDPDPPTDQFPPLPAPPGWPASASQQTSRDSVEYQPAVEQPVRTSGVDASTLDQLFADLPSLAPEDAPIVSPDSGAWAAPDLVYSPDSEVPEAVALDHVAPDDAAAPDALAPDDAAPDDAAPDDVAPEVVDGFVASHDAPDAPEASAPLPATGPARFEPAEAADGAIQHQPVKVVNEYEPSLGEDTPGGSTTVVYRDDPDASIMEVRPTSNDVLTTSILQVIASNDDPVRIGVPTTLRPISGPARTAGPAGPAPEQLSGADVKAMTDAVRDAADRLRANPGADDTYAISEALRDMASSLGRLADRFGK